MSGVRAATVVSERRISRVLGQVKLTQRYTARRRGDVVPLPKRILELTWAHPRRGYRMICGLFPLEGWSVNTNRVERLRLLESLKVPGKTAEERTGSSSDPVGQERTIRPTEACSIHFVHNSDDRGRALKWLSVANANTR